MMHKDIPSAVIKLSSEQGKTYVEKILSLHNVDHLPTGTVYPGARVANPRRIENWINERSIPKERSGLKRIIDYLGLPYPNQLLLDSLGLSLSDQYWMRPLGSGIAWRDVNFFQNEFSKDLGEILTGEANDAKGRIFVSPDASSSGNLPKKWIVSEGRRILMKGGKFPYFQEPQNEAIASRVMESLGIEHVNYELAFVRDKAYSLCETFVDCNTDFVSAYYIADMCSGMPSDESEAYYFFLEWCERRGIPGAREAMDRIFVADFILLNTDRHLNNFGALRDAETLEWKGFSPVFDTGNCLWNEHATEIIYSDAFAECKPFWSDFREQLRHVSDFSWIDLEKLNGLPELIPAMFKQTKTITPERVGLIHGCFWSRVKFLENSIRNP
jgi:hypothetical protein